MKAGRRAGRARLAARATVGLAALGAALALAAPLGADPVTGGKSVLTPDHATFEGLADMSIGVDATGAAKFRRNGAKFPIAGGDVREGPRGSIEHRGGMVFLRRGGGPRVKVSKFTIEIGRNKTKLFAKSGRSELRFLDLDLSDATIGGSAGVSLRISGAEATLAKQAAEVLSDVFDFPFRKGIPIGEFNIRAQVG
jgi:hypothetical protein